MRAEYGRERSELHPADKSFFIGIAHMPAAIGIHIRDAVVRALYQRVDFLRKRVGRACDIPRPLDRIAVTRARINFQITTVRHIIDVAHDDGTAVNLFIARNILPIMTGNVLEQIQPERFVVDARGRRDQFG